MDKREELVENVAGQESPRSHRPSAIPIRFYFIDPLVDRWIRYRFPFLPLLKAIYQLVNESNLAFLGISREV